MQQLDDLLAGAKVGLSNELPDQIDKIVPPGVDIAPLEGSAYPPPAISEFALRRRPISGRSVG